MLPRRAAPILELVTMRYPTLRAVVLRHWMSLATLPVRPLILRCSKSVVVSGRDGQRLECHGYGIVWRLLHRVHFYPANSDSEP